MKHYKTPRDIKAGVVGYGGAFDMGKMHLTEMRNAGMTPAAAADIDPTRLEIASADFPEIGTYPSVSEMLRKSDVDLIAIVTPHNTHHDLALKCLDAGRHVVCEKPFALTTEQCDAMINAAKRNEVLLSTYHNRHWDGCIMHAVKKIRSGAIGSVHRVEAHMGGYAAPGDWWRSSRSISGGILYDWGVHLLEYSLQIIDSHLVEVSGFARTGVWASSGKWKDDTVEDEAQAVARFSNGSWLILTISSIEPNPKRGWLEISGDKGSYIMGWDWWEIITHPRNETVIRKGSNPKSEWWRYYKNIAEHLTVGAPLVITPEWARRPIHIIDLACRSARKGAALKTKYP